MNSKRIIKAIKPSITIHRRTGGAHVETAPEARAVPARSTSEATRGFTNCKAHRAVNALRAGDAPRSVRPALTLCAVLSVLLCVHFAHSQGTAFTYQGRLNDGGAAANGRYDLQFTLFDAANAGNQVGAALTNAATTVSNGFFTAMLDFGAVAFPGADRWLEIGVVTNGGGSFTTLNPRQKITSTPYAIQSANAASAVSVSGSISAAQLTGAISSNNIGAGSITSVMLAAGAVGSNQLADGAVTADKMATVSFPLLLTITNPTPADFDNFGQSVAAVGNDRVLIGAWQDDTGANNAGAAYLFSTAGALLTTFTNPTAGSGTFGDSVAALGNDRVLIGASGDDTGAGDAGAAYLFSANGALLMTFTNPAPAGGDNFGNSVAAVGTDRVLIAAWHDDTGGFDAGTAYLFSTNGALLTTFTNPMPATDHPNFGDNFGVSVAAVGTDRVLIGSYWDDQGAYLNSGTAYLFSTNGALLTTITNPAPELGDWFGVSVAAVGSDQVLIGAFGDETGAPNAGAAYLFTTTGTLLKTFTNPTPANSDFFGYSVAAVGADRVLIGAWGASGSTGKAHLYSASGSLLATFANPTPASGDRFGWAVATIGADRVLIGARNDGAGASAAGAAYVFGLDTYVPDLIADSVRARSIITASLADGAVTASKIGGVLFASQLPDLDASKITSGTLADARLSTNVALLNAHNQFTGTNGLNDRDLRLRGNTDPNHAVGWYGSGKPFAGFSPDGPMLFGYAAGGLGTTISTQKLALMWNSLGRVGIGTANPASTLEVAGAVTATSFSGNGGGLTNLAAANLTGTVADSRLSGNVALLSGLNVFTGANRFSGQVIVTNLNNQFAGTFTGTLYGSAPYLKFAEVTTGTTQGGTANAGTNNWREFNFEMADTHNLGSTNNSGAINLPPGTYQCRISAPAYQVSTHQIRLRPNGGSTLIYGTIAYSGAANDRSIAEGQFTLASTTTLRVQHWCFGGNPDNGLGAMDNEDIRWGDALNFNVFATAEFWKIK